MVQFFLLGAIPSSMSGMSHLPFVGPVSPSQSFSIPPDVQLGGCEIAIPACPVNNPSKTSAFPLSTSTSFSSFSPIGSTSMRVQSDKGFQEPQNPQLPSTLPWPFPPGLSLPAPSQSQNATEHQIQPHFPSAQSPTLPSLPRPRLIRSHSIMGNHCPLFETPQSDIFDPQAPLSPLSKGWKSFLSPQLLVLCIQRTKCR